LQESSSKDVERSDIAQEVQTMVRPYVSEEVTLDPEMRSTEVLDFERRLLGKIVGQDRAVRRIVNMYQIYLAGMSMPGRPIGNLLFLGPTGSGKTRVVEASAELLFGNPRAFIKIDCAEFQHSHEIAKLIGSPPGYLGHRETSPLLTQEAIDQYQTDRVKMTFILFDEIEKASDSLWQLLLGILDKGTLTLGDNRRVDLSRCVIFMTSNLGAHEMSDMLNGGSIGFTSGAKHNSETLAVLDNKLYRTALEVARRKFSPEFMNRLDKVVVFRTLTEEDLREILEIELNDVQNRIIASQSDRQFIFRMMPESKEFLLQEGTDLKYGARHLKRAIERHLVYPLSNLIATGQINQGDIIRIDLHDDGQKLIFARERSFPSFASETPTAVGFAARKANKVGARIAVTEVQAAGVDRLRKV
jgi:ATP-dependent Clp protease ATP-binding subunit ClpA